MRSQQVKNSFDAGVRSPRLTLRSDIDQYTQKKNYASALQILINFIVSPQGGIRMRSGLQNMVAVPVTGEPSRIFQFHRGGDESDIIVNLSYADAGVHYYVDGVKDPISTAHDFPSGTIDEIQFTNQERSAVITHQSRPPYVITQDYDGTISGEHISQNQVPLVLFNDSKSPSRVLNVDERSWTFTFVGPWVAGTTYIISYGPTGAIGPNGEPINDPVFANYNSSIDVNIGNIRNILNDNAYLSSPETEVIVTNPTADNKTFEITLKGRNSFYTLSGSFSSEISGLDVTVVGSGDPPQTTSTEPAWSYPYVVLHNGNYYQCLQPHFSEADNLPAVGASWTTYWTDLGATKPTWFDWQHPTGNAWGLGIFYAPWDRGFPAVAVFNQQRLLLMGTPDVGTGIWGSRIGDYSWFTLGPNDDDAFYFNLDTSDAPQIRWAQAQSKLIVGTSSGDYSVSALVTISPTDIQAEKQNSARSNLSGAVVINTDIFYIEQGKEKIRSTTYNDDLKSQTSSEISLVAEHLLHNRVSRLTLMQTPQVMVVGMRDDSSLVCFTYNHEVGTGAWFEFETQGTVVDVCTGYTSSTDPAGNGGDDEDELWVLTTYDGTNYELEKMPFPSRTFTAPVNQGDMTLTEQGIVYFDSWSTGTIDVGDNNIITGLERYEGTEIAVTVEDAYAGVYTVQDGAVILETDESGENYEGIYAVGYAYTASGKTFEVDAGNPKGSAFGTKRRWNKMYVRLLDSALPIVNGVLPPDRHPQTLMNIPELIRTGITDPEIKNLGWDDGAITIIQDRPYPTHVLGFYGEFNSNNA